MIRTAPFFLIAGSALLGCGDTATSDPEPASLSAESTLGESFHLGEPFEIVNGVIRADSNEYGLQASFYATRDPAETDIEVTVTTGKICIQGAITPAVEGDFGSYWGITFGFIASRGDEVRPPVRITGEPRQIDSVVPWDLNRGRVLGIAASFSGPRLPAPGMPELEFGIGLGGTWDQEGVIQALTIYTDCKGVPRITTSGQAMESLFAYMENDWCSPLKTRWSAPSMDNFFYGIGSQIVADAAASASVSPAPYDFCISDIRPILAGAPR